MMYTMVELIHILSCIRIKKLLCFLYPRLILGNTLKALLKMLEMNLLMLNQMELNWKKVYIATTSAAAELCDNHDAPCYTMLCRYVFFFQMLLCHAQCILLSLTFCRRLMMKWNRGQLQFKKGRMMRISPCWTCTSRPHHQASSRRQVGQRVRFGFSRHACTKTAISSSYGIQIRCS